MILAQLWVYTILIIFLLHHPILITAISSLIDDKFNFSMDNKKASTTGEIRAFTYNNIVNLTIVIFTILNIIVHKLRELHEANYSEEDQNILLSSGTTCRRFSLAEILLATHNFDDECLIGKGGSAKVYKGVIDNGATTVAIKRLSFISKQAVGSMFNTEIEMLSKFRHSHLVSLVGYCHERHEMILVFEYISNGTLSDHLHQSFTKGYNTLSWIQRLRICIGAAQGLDYLHTGTSIYHRVIHRDVKSSNILLDNRLEAKIADFGISKIVAANEGCTYASTAVKGTFGYMDPAYFLTGRLTRKSDVYAFGVVLFEVLSGRRAVDLSRDDELLGLAEWAQNCIKQGRINEIIDSNLKMQISQKSLLAFVKIASQCLNRKPSCRPTIAEVVVVLEFALALQRNSDSAGDRSGQYSTAVEVVYGKDQIKPFEINRTRITFSRKVYQVLSTSIRSLSVHSKAKNIRYNGNKNSRVDSRVSQNKAGIFAEANNRMRINKIGIIAEANGLFATANSRSFSLAELASATRGFSPDMILGENIYGKAFIGWLDDDTLAPSRIGIGMAVRIKRTSSYARFRTMQAEVDLCGRFDHPNVLKPLGFCSEDQELLLVYEYSPKGNIARYAYKDEGKTLSWVIWLKILIGVAKYLDFLHSSDEHVIFGDFTLSNILLDGDFNPKIAFSVNARFGPEDCDTLVTGIPDLNAHRAVSEGYFSPEYKEAGYLSSKNDVYAFGVVLLEILTGMRVIDVNSKNKKKTLVDKARPVLACERKVKSVVNPKLLEQEKCPKIVNSILSDVPALALKCLDLNPKKRPSMRQVVEILERVDAIIN